MASAIKSALAGTFLIVMSAAAGADIPTLNVERMCRESAKADPTTNFDPKRCLDSENNAREELAARWTSFPASDRQQCTQLATLGGTASYVALITCLEMNRDARQERAGTQSQPSSMRKK
jgi:hypothetical protein